MTDPTAAGVSGVGSGAGPSLTRGFLFADLRGYTRLVESHGAVRAAELLERYRSLVREAVGRFGGAEIKTEGDSFYVVFDSVSAGVRCGMAIQAAAAEASAAVPDPAIKVGVGIHAGETVAVADGYVGSAVNVAARLCSLAGPGEVLVSETVRTLTQTIVPVVFEPRGRQRLKGVPDPVTVFSVMPVAEAEDAWAVALRADQQRRRRRRRALAAAGGIIGLALLVGTAAYALRPPPALPPGPWTIGVDLPLTGPAAVDFGRATADAVKLAVQDANAAGDLGVELQIDTRDHGGAEPDILNFEQAAENSGALASDPRVIAVVGPANSPVARDQIPVTNKAGLLQCSPSTTDPALTKPRDGALDIRKAAPNRVNFIRTVPADDIQGKAAASHLKNELGVDHLLVIEDTEFEGALPADSVQQAFEQLGGVVTRRSLNPGADPSSALEPLTSGGDAPDAVFYGGFGTDVALAIRASMISSGAADVPYVFWDWVGGTDPAIVEDLGSGAAGTYTTTASFAPPRSAFVDRYRAAYGREPGPYDAAAYACIEVIVQALRDLAAKGPSAATIREDLRARVVDTANRYETVLGTIGFDANGDSLQQFAEVFRADAEGARGEPEWVLENAQDYGPAP